MEPPYRFVDAAGRAWDVYDFKLVAGRKKRVPINRWDAEARAFVALDTGEVLIYKDYFSYQSTEPKILANQLHYREAVARECRGAHDGGLVNVTPPESLFRRSPDRGAYRRDLKRGPVTITVSSLGEDRNISAHTTFEAVPQRSTAGGWRRAVV